MGQWNIPGERKMATIKLQTPVSEEEIRKIRVGDILYISGTAITARDEAHMRALEHHEEEKPLPVSFAGVALYHCGPLVKKTDDKWEVVVAGPTTSIRMETLEYDFIKIFRPKVVIGKGGMGDQTAKAMREFGAVYCDYTGGAAVLAANAIEEVEKVEWLDLGMPEALWVLRVKEFGPLVVTIDTLGKNLHEDLTREIEAKKDKILGV
jgi:fumarate hydratase subunit beta